MGSTSALGNVPATNRSCTFVVGDAVLSFLKGQAFHSGCRRVPPGINTISQMIKYFCGILAEEFLSSGSLPPPFSPPPLLIF